MTLSRGSAEKESRPRDTGGGEWGGRSERDEWSGMEHIHYVLCETDGQWKWLCESRRSDQSSDNLEGAEGGRWEGGLRGRGHVVPVAHSR